MISTGNDIVDLSKINSQRTALPRFFGKMLVPAEIEMYDQYSVLPFTTYVWLLWSIKESVFKYHKRHNPALPFAPRKTIVQELFIAKNAIAQLDNAITENHTYSADVSVRSIVSLDGLTFYGTSYLFRDVIHSVATASPEQQTQWGIQYIASDNYEQQSEAARSLFTNHFSRTHTGEITIEKNSGGCPFIAIDNVLSEVPVSFSHHGNYVAYAYLPPRQ